MRIVAMGLACPLGLQWANVGAAVRSGLNPFWELDYVDDEGEPVVGAALERLDAFADPRDRWLQLLAWALTEALADVHASQRLTLPVVLALPANVRGHTFEPSWVELTLRRFVPDGLGFDPSMVAIMPSEQPCAGFRALSWARDYLVEHEFCLVCGADSLISARPLAQLSHRRRLLTTSNPDGVIPGEAAACVLLGRQGSSCLAHVRGIGFGHEPGLRTNDVPLRGMGVLQAARAALSEAGWTMKDIDLRISDAGGESYDFKEQALLLPRLLQAPKPELPLLLPATCLGHTGAAAGLCGLVLGVETLACQLGPGPRIMCFAGGIGPERAAVVVESNASRGS